jgi:hypothetical protein
MAPIRGIQLQDGYEEAGNKYASQWLRGFMLRGMD